MVGRPDLQTEAVPREKRYFTVAEANRALPLVKRIARDIDELYGQVLSTQEQIQRLQDDSRSDEADEARDRLVELLQRLQEYADELADIGAQLKDWESGLVDFPAVHHNREILLCWRRGEESIQYWHEPGEGAAGRQPISLLEPRVLGNDDEG